MNPTFRPLFPLLVAGALGVAAAHAADPKPTPAEVPPPPGLHDPGVSAAPAAATAETPATAPAASEEDALAPLPKPDARLVRDKASREAAANAQRMAASEVTTRQQGTDRVEEYRQHGRLWMVRILPPNGGPIQSFLANDVSGRLLRDPAEGPVAPVYYSLYEWQ